MVVATTPTTRRPGARKSFVQSLETAGEAFAGAMLVSASQASGARHTQHFADSQEFDAPQCEHTSWAAPEAVSMSSLSLIGILTAFEERASHAECFNLRQCR
jgi:hypothetical protein